MGYTAYYCIILLLLPTVQKKKTETYDIVLYLFSRFREDNATDLACTPLHVCTLQYQYSSSMNHNATISRLRRGFK